MRSVTYVGLFALVFGCAWWVLGTDRHDVSAAPAKIQAVEFARHTEHDTAASNVAGPATSPSLLGSLQGLTHPVSLSGIETIQEPRDKAVMIFYKTQLMQITFLDEKKLGGAVLTPDEMDTMAISHAVKTCMEKERYWYLGPKRAMPKYWRLQSQEKRYIATAIGDYGIVIELDRDEYPAVFEHHPRFRKK